MNYQKEGENQVIKRDRGSWQALIQDVWRIDYKIIWKFISFNQSWKEKKTFIYNFFKDIFQLLQESTKDLTYFGLLEDVPLADIFKPLLILNLW